MAFFSLLSVAAVPLTQPSPAQPGPAAMVSPAPVQFVQLPTSQHHQYPPFCRHASDVRRCCTILGKTPFRTAGFKEKVHVGCRWAASRSIAQQISNTACMSALLWLGSCCHAAATRRQVTGPPLQKNVKPHVQCP